MPKQNERIFVDVILPLSLPQNYTYEVPVEFADEAEPGKRVVVQFGRKRYYAALIYRLHQKAPENYKTKPIISVLDQERIVTPGQIKFWEWMWTYYMCYPGDLLQAALPAGFKLASETRIILHPDAKEDDFPELDEQEYLIAEAVSIRKELKIQEIQEILDLKSVYPVIRNLLDKRIIYLREELDEGYAPKREEFLILPEKYSNSDARKELFSELSKAPKQQEAMLHFFNLKKKVYPVRKADLTAAVEKNYQSVSALIKKGMLEVVEKEVSRLNGEKIKISGFELSPAQKTAKTEILQHFNSKDVVLLHGVTSSGKTEIYAELMREKINEGKQVLFLLPEIALTAQLIIRLRKYFGNDIGIYHSRFNSNERVEIWNKVLKKEYKIILGARSSLFLPFTDLGMIVVDEEHDPSFKQFDPAPRYHARDSAIFMASLCGAKVLLGSATPSMESYYNAQQDKYGLVNLTERYGNMQMPVIKILDISKSQRAGHHKSHLSEELLKDLKVVLENKKQAILFRNRRGYSSTLICGTCAYMPQCKNCDVSLTYHKLAGLLKCHYCNFKQKTVTSCPACGSHNMQIQGFGTEKLEDELNLFFKDIKVARLDYDSVRSKHGHQKIIRDFEEGKVDVLVGTQMVTKGLDFENVTLSSIVNADQLLLFPDFRSAERAFQLMVQVAGRSGRKNVQGEVIIQAKNINHPVLKFVLENNFENFYFTEVAQRKQFLYPPLVRIIKLHLRHKDKEILNHCANAVYRQLTNKLGRRVYPPSMPFVGRIRNYYLLDMLIKLEKNAEKMKEAKNNIRDVMNKMAADPTFRNVRIYADVDPN